MGRYGDDMSAPICTDSQPEKPPYIQSKMNTLRKKRMVKVNAMSQARLIKLLMDGTHTCAELAVETGLHYITVQQYTRELHLVGAAHVCMWEKDARGRDCVRVFKLGCGKDAPRQKLTCAQRSARYREKKKALALHQRFVGVNQ